MSANSSAKAGQLRHQAQRCRDCVHLFVTYDPGFPYGCRAMGFKSRRPPSHEVQAASGAPCQMWRAKGAVDKR